MSHTVTNPIKLSLHSFRGWRISPRKRPDGRWHDGARSISRSSKSIDRKEEISKMIINTSIIACFQFHPRYRSLLWESCTRPNGDAWLSERSVGFLDTRFTLTSGNINDQHSFLYERSNLHDPIEEPILELFSPILTPWVHRASFVTMKYMMELDASWSVRRMKRWHKLLLVF